MTRDSAAVLPLHTAIPGRARLHVVGLRRDGGLRARLERRLPLLPGMLSVSASVTTGNLLLEYDPAVPLSRVIARVADLAGPAETEGDALSPAWHHRPAAKVSADLGSSAVDGLEGKEARNRLAIHGRNALAPPRRRSGLAILARQFASLPVALLGIAATVSFLSGGGILEASAILSVIALNAAIGTAVETRAERTIASLADVGRPRARVIRGGEVRFVPMETLVPGDLFLLERGTVVPADGRVVSADDLTVSEAALTGESAPVAKTPETVKERRVPLAGRTNMVYRGTVITGGTGRALAVGTGPRSEVGQIAGLVAASETPETPLQRQLAALGRQLVWLSAAICGAVFGIGLLRGLGIARMARSSLSLAVAAIPEGLPTVATTTLALGVEDMRRRNVLIRRLDAIETLAAVQVVCLDKTGTLTCNDMAVARIAAADERRLLEIGALCSETVIGEPLIGSATENALVREALARDIDVAALRRRYPRRAIRLRSEACRFMVTVHDSEAGLFVAVKGSPDEVLERCSWILEAGGTRIPLAESRRAAIREDNGAMAAEALRVLGFACRDKAAGEAADVGIALGRGGTAAAREVADVVVNTDDPLVLAVAIERGRTTYTNIRKAIRYLLSTNLSEILVVLAASAAGTAEILTPMQLLWINLITDVLPGLGLACEPPEPEAMAGPPRPADGRMVRREDFGALLREAAVIAGGATAAGAYGAMRYGAAAAQTRTLAFGSLVTAQLLHALACRSPRHGMFDRRLPANPILAGTLALSFAVQGLALLIPGLRRLLGIARLGPLDLAVGAAAGLLPVLLNESIKGSGDTHPTP